MECTASLSGKGIDFNVSQNVDITSADALSGLFKLCRSGTRMFCEQVKIDERNRGFAKGRLDGIQSDEILMKLNDAVPIALKSPFEGCDAIAGGVWRGEHQDAIAKLRFEKGALDLPMHVHEWSERWIIVAGGHGHYHIAIQDDLESFDGSNIQTFDVKVGDIVCFTRGVVHTFGTPLDNLVLLSYHSPFIDLDTPRQYTIPKVRICPRNIV